MNMKSIISRTESLQILKNQLRKDALEKRAAELKDACLTQPISPLRRPIHHRRFAPLSFLTGCFLKF